MTHLAQMIADALAQSPDTVVRQLASEVVRLRAEAAAWKADGMPRDRDELQRMLNDAQRAGNQAAHDAHAAAGAAGLKRGVAESENMWELPDGSRLIATNFPPCGCIACELRHRCSDGTGMRCTPKERSDSRRITWVKPGSRFAP